MLNWVCNERQVGLQGLCKGCAKNFHNNCILHHCIFIGKVRSRCGSMPSWTRFLPKLGIPRSSNKTWGLKSKVLMDNYGYLFCILLVLPTIHTVCFQYM